MKKRRVGRVLALLVIAFVLSACGLLFDFGGYDTSDAERDATAGDASAVDASGGFDLIVPSALTIEPGAPPVLLAVSITRHGNEDARVVVSVPDPPAELATILALTVEPDASSASLQIAAMATAAPGNVMIQVSATDGTLSITKPVALTLRGASCTLDRGFGPEQNGVVTVGTEAIPDAYDDGFFIATDPVSVTVGAHDMRPAGPAIHLLRLDHVGGVVWDKLSLVVREGVMAADRDGGTFATYEGTVRRYLPNGALDPSFEDASVPCVPVSYEATGPPALAVLCMAGEGSSWSLSELGPTGASPPPVAAPFVPPATGPSAVHYTGAGFVACGAGLDGMGDRQPAFSRWALDGAVDPSFGDGGTLRFEVSGQGDVDDCVADDAGAVAIGVVGKGLAFFGITAGGSPDPAFGDGGVRSLAMPGVAVVDSSSSRVVESGSSLLALVTPDDDDTAAVLARYDRKTGQLDTSFGAAGYCALSQLGHGLGRAVALAVTGDGKVVILANGFGSLIIGRLWL